MTEPLRVLVWASSFGADLWSLTKFLDARDDVEVKVVMADPELFRSQPVAKLYPLSCEVIKRSRWREWLGVPGFRPHVTVLDNWVPRRATSKAGFVLWHGFGWKGPNDREEFATLHRKLGRAFGDPLAPNPHFRWHCFGPSDREHRTKVSGFHPDNIAMVGAASHDDLRVPFDRDKVKGAYPFDVAGRKNLLIAPTWHYGEVFAHWGKDEDIFGRLFATASDHGANTIVRLHDSFRFETGYLQRLRDLAGRHPNVLLKFKDQAPDNYIDLQVADALVTNYSSIANLFYATRRPTIHVYPVADADADFTWLKLTNAGVQKSTVSSARYVWKFPPEQHGGLLARSADEMVAQVDQALSDPTCCERVADDFLSKHMMGADGLVCQRVHTELLALR